MLLSLMIITTIHINSIYYQEHSQSSWEEDLQTISAVVLDLETISAAIKWC